MNVTDWIGDWMIRQVHRGWTANGNLKIISITNPGWMFVVNLKKTPLEKITDFHEGKVISKNDWYFVTIKNNYFRASGDPTKLFLLLEKFAKLSAKSEGYVTLEHNKMSPIFDTLVDIYRQLCEKEWQFENTIKIISSEMPGWNVAIDLKRTAVENVTQKYKYFTPNNLSWYGWEISEKQFLGRSSPQNLATLIDIYSGVMTRSSETEALN